MSNFDDAELVLGGFRSIRYFLREYGGKHLTSISQLDIPYTQPNKEYQAVCLNQSFHDGNTISLIEKLMPEVFEDSCTAQIIDEQRLPGRRKLVLKKWISSSLTIDRTKYIYQYVAVDIDEVWFNDLSHSAPKKGCTCGFYSFYNLGTEESYLNPRKKIVSVVENYGRVIHGKLGLRSEKMKILGVAPSDFTIEVPEYFTSISYPSVDDLLAALPLSRTEGLFND